MRAGILIIAGIFAAVLSCRAQEKVVQNFDGMKELTTPTFQVADKWELRWSGTSAITLTLLDDKGSIVAGTTARSDGSLYESKGGTFYLKITATPAMAAAPWRVSAIEMAASTGSGSPAVYMPPIQIPLPAPGAPSSAVAMAAAANLAPSSPSASAAPADSGMTQAQGRAGKGGDRLPPALAAGIATIQRSPRRSRTLIAATRPVTGTPGCPSRLRSRFAWMARSCTALCF